MEGKDQENFYDGENLRARLTENGKKTTSLYHNGEILAECEGESVPIRKYLRGNDLSKSLVPSGLAWSESTSAMIMRFTQFQQLRSFKIT